MIGARQRARLEAAFFVRRAGFFALVLRRDARVVADFREVFFDAFRAARFFAGLLVAFRAVFFAAFFAGFRVAFFADFAVGFFWVLFFWAGFFRAGFFRVGFFVADAFLGFGSFFAGRRAGEENPSRIMTPISR